MAGLTPFLRLVIEAVFLLVEEWVLLDLACWRGGRCSSKERWNLLPWSRQMLPQTMPQMKPQTMLSVVHNIVMLMCPR